MDCAGALYRCVVRGGLKTGDRKERSPLAVGDWVQVVPEPDDGATPPPASISYREDRKGVWSRASAHNTRIEQVIAANVDQMIGVLSAADIGFHLGLLDRLLISAAESGFRPVVIVNKVDLVPSVDVAGAMSPYVRMGVTVLPVSATQGAGIAEVRTTLKDRTTVFCGPSGVGKSSILNAVQPSLSLQTSHVKDTGAGRHTTTSVSLLPLDGGGYVVDTPGVREFGLWNFPKEELGLWYPDFSTYRSACRYTGCTHTHEPGCAVTQAARNGGVDAGRYERYVQIYRSLEETVASRWK